ncbi:Cyclic-AMP phosphodiesterase class-II [Penicillium angulare]|uniref:Cyclic-AMP phosphodiesterase class-II n=1 Tax=Penicillium angulare TaxID=116970 RepID=A0A9W9K941_9EURO|nr:Cyclic-AMP phosphodiesterase class-II [Penicillium angulare]
MSRKSTFEVIVLGPTGGPREDAVTGLLVRSKSTDWAPGSMVAVDAGTMLAGIIRLLKPYVSNSKNGRQGATLKEGPFRGLKLPARTAEANAAYIFREIIGAFLITHPHLDHVSGLAINTPIIEAGSGPKPVAALPSVLSAIKNHVFNDIIWPNLSDEDGGAGLLTYQRLVEGGNPRFGSGDSRGYVRACQGIVTKCLSVSHGRCKQRYHPESGTHHRASSTVFHSSESRRVPTRAISDHSEASFYSPVHSPRLGPSEPMVSTVESSAFFLRDHDSGDEIIIFGDVEPDTVSLEPRNRRVWETAAPKVASRALRAIFIECSYSDSVDDAYLYGHLCPRHLIAELMVLAEKVIDAREQAPEKKRKREAGTANTTPRPQFKRSHSSSGRKSRSGSTRPQHTEPLDAMGDLMSSDHFSPPNPTRWANSDPPLAGFSVYIIHIKETLKDGSYPGNIIVQELTDRAEALNLGCQFFLPSPTESISI